MQEADGSTATVVRVRSVPGAADMWDLTVAHVHTFAVGSGAFVVHNCGDEINPRDVRFTQDSIGATHRDGHTVAGNIDQLRSGALKPRDMDPIRIFKKTPEMDGWAGNLDDGRLYTLDNRRLYEFQQAGIDQVPYTWASADDVYSQRYKFTTRNGGTSIRVRGGW